MPGIVGIISQKSAVECEALLGAMLDSMKHESFYNSGTCSVPEMNIYSGWVSMEGSFADRQIFTNGQHDILLIFSGECFNDRPENTRANLNDQSPQKDRSHWLISLYEKDGIEFIEQLNGLFSGLLIDRRQRKAFLFNDRYGVERIYYAETSDGLFFASEAKAILRVRPDLRSFDEQGVAEFLNFGCTLDGRTLFQNIQLLPGGSVWTFDHGTCRKGTYFTPRVWESQPTLSEEEFEFEFQQTFKRVLPRYFAGEEKLGISLTAGLDTRMIMACRPDHVPQPFCYTYSGERIDTLDARIAGQIAKASGLDHKALHIGSEFFSDFASFADRTVYITDACFGVTGAHEIYMSQQARQIAPARLTGNYGGEILRGISTFKPAGLSPDLLSPALTSAKNASARRLSTSKHHQITFAAFREVPWNLIGNLMAGRSQLRFRTPYLDNEIVALAYRAPENLRRSRNGAIKLIRDNNSTLAQIPTDKGHLGNAPGPLRSLRRAFAEVTFKLDYLNNEGFPNWLSPIDPLIQAIGPRLGLLGLHKHLHYRSWFRRELADYIHTRTRDSQLRECPFWNINFLDRLATDHVSGRKNYVLELNAVLTLEAAERLLFRDLPRGISSRSSSPATVTFTERSKFSEASPNLEIKTITANLAR